MKFLITLTLLGFSSLTFACVDLSGTYRDSKDASVVQLIQKGCESLTIVDKDQTSVWILDGVERELASQDVIVDGNVTGKVIVFGINQIGENELNVSMRVHIETNGASTDQLAKSVVSFNSDGDLVSVITQIDGRVDTSIGIRIK